MLTGITKDIEDAFAVGMPQGQPSLTAMEIENLTDVCSIAFGESIHPRVIEGIIRHCSFIDSRISGRAAGKIGDLVIRYLFRYYACRIAEYYSRERCHIEIGVLFGAGVIIAYEASRLAGKSVPIIAIDPFKGFYGANVDPITKLEVTEERFRYNVSLFDIPDCNIELITGYSTNLPVYQRCQALKPLSVFIDGDHSYEGVLSDWSHFGTLTVPGGFVLIDDYDNPTWPDVTRCVDDEILPYLDEDWVTRLKYGNSLLLQRGAVRAFPST